MESNRSEKRHSKLFLIVINVILIFSAVLFSWAYSRNLQERQDTAALDTFMSTIESMKQISDNYLHMELEYAEDWAKYINYHDMTVDEALHYINLANNQSDRYAHIIDMETFDAYSTYEKNESNSVHCYLNFSKESNNTDKIFMENMRQMFAGDDRFHLLGKYRTDDTQLNVISVGTPVSLQTADGRKKDYLLLRVIPVESIRNILIFPVEYKSAEVGIITQSGAYVIQSPAMRTLSFSDFIRSYNFMDDYNKVEELVTLLSTSEKGILEYRDSKAQDCYWYYSSFGEDSGLDILGYIPVDQLDSHKTDWTIVAMTCSVLFLLTLLDGAYILHMNRKLRETAKLAVAASVAKTRFLSTMSHDIRTPMNGIIGMTDIASMHTDDPEYTRECLDKISLASDHLLTLINDILDISKVESGSMVLNPAPFSIEHSIDKLIDIVQVQIHTNQLVFTVHKDLPYPYLIADELRLNQIFINILTNAVKYTPMGGSITMNVWEESLPNGKIRLTYQVADTGMGMSEDFQKDMYTMFSREVDSRINNTQGSGLGLAIVKQMVELMNGTISCDSAPGKGTTFTIAIDLEEAPAQESDLACVPPSETESDFHDFQGIHVLVAEDNDLNWEIIQELLHQSHVECDRAVNGEECANLLWEAKEGTYDLVLMDVQMPVMNGREATRILRQSPRADLREIPIFAMTADAFAEDIQACLDAGMNGHIAKPVDMKKVLEILRQVKNRKREETKENETK